MTETVNVYAKMAGEYADLVGDALPDELKEFIAALPSGGRVLDLGCGPGHHAAHMAKAGLDVLATDATPEMVSLAAHHKGVTAQCAKFDDIPRLGQFHGIWASFSLLHATRSDFPRHLADISSALLPGGLFCAGLKLGEGEGPDRLGRHYSYYTEAELRDAILAAGMKPGNVRLGEAKGLAGDVEPWIVIFAHA